MYLFTCLRQYICIYTYIHTYIHIHIHTHISIYVRSFGIHWGQNQDVVARSCVGHGHVAGMFHETAGQQQDFALSKNGL